MPKAGEKWELYRLTGKDVERGLTAGIERIRELEESEVEELSAAAARMESFAAGWGWNKVLGCVEPLNNALTQAVATGSSGPLPEASQRRCIEALTGLVREVDVWLESEMERLQKQPGDDAESLLARLHSLSAGHSGLSFVRGVVSALRDGSVGLALTSSGTIVEGAGIPIAPRDWDSREVSELVRLLLGDLEQVAIAVLLFFEAPLYEAGRTLLRVQAEVVHGSAAIGPAVGDEGPRAFRFRPLPVATIGPVMEAIRVAQVSASPLEPQRDPPNADEAKTPPPKETPSGQSTGRQRGASVGDLFLLAQHVASLSVERERRWSEALGDSLSDDEFTAQWSSLLRALRDRVEAFDSELAERGVSNTISRFPLDPDQAGSLASDASAEQLSWQSAVAGLYVLRDLLSALEGLSKPSVKRVDLDRRVFESWWDSGAFSRVRQLALVVARLSELQEADLRSDQVERSYSEYWPADWAEHAELASLALDRGLMWAAIYHSGAAVQMLLRRMESPASHAAATMASVPILAPLTPVVDSLLKAVSDASSGRPVSYSFAVAMAYFVVPILERAVASAPDLGRSSDDPEEDQ